jgi:hypothetical protein
MNSVTETNVGYSWKRMRRLVGPAYRCHGFTTKQNIQTGKCHVLIIWSSYGLHSGFAFPKGEHHNSTLFVNIVALGLQTHICSGTQQKISLC